jgi:hypothetical protein
MRFNLNQEKKVKEEILLTLIPAFAVKEIEEMTGLTESNIAYYRRKNKTPTYTLTKRKLEAEAQQNIRDQLEHKRKYALSVVEDVLHENGILYE